MTQQKYLPKSFEKNIWDSWEKNKVYQTPETGDQKQYVLVMFPYPSGAGLHVGHVRVYTGTDVLARYFRMNGKSVLHPMGWDAFGLPAENAAIKAKTNPKKLVPQYIDTFKRQLKSIGLSYDWDRELATIDPTYYRWTQWLFITFFKMGLLYKKNTLVYFCEFCKTGLAEEEVLPDGTHERCQKQITRRELPQWMFRITSYADRLEKDLKGLDWPKGILEMQKNWIGKKEGINVTYDVVTSDESRVTSEDSENQQKDGESRNSKLVTRNCGKITVFTTRPDTNFGATFVVLAPEHEFVKDLVESLKSKVESREQEERRIQVAEYVKASLAKTDVERQMEGRKKTGVFTGYYAVNQLTGRKMPIWVSDFVLASVGTGAVVGVPGHDMRDFEFAREFGIDVLRVVSVDGETGPIETAEQVQEDFGTMVNSGFLDGMNIHEAIDAMKDHLVEKGWGERVTTYHLRDWIFSRQRYWGEPIPMVYCAACAKKGISWWDTEEGKREVESRKLKVTSRSGGYEKYLGKAAKDAESDRETTEISAKKADQTTLKNIEETRKTVPGWFPIDHKSLPLELPDMESYEPDGSGKSPLAQDTEWLNATCPHCGGSATRETDTMPNWAGSCWYFLYFAIPKDVRAKLGFSDNENPITNASVNTWLPVDWYIGGAEHAVLHLLYSRFWVKALHDKGYLNFIEPFQRLRTVGIVLAEDNRKMSKSWGNVINPDDVIAEYGADTLRLYEMFMAPFNQEIAWSTTALAGAFRFLKRIWKLYHTEYSNKPTEESNHELAASLNRTIAKVSQDIPQIKYNTSIAAMMEFLNEWEKNVGDKSKVVFGLSVADAKKFLQILAPFAPYMTEQLWKELFKEADSIHTSSWPTVDKSAIKRSNVQIPVQISGKTRGVITVSSEYLAQSDVIAAAEADERIKKHLEGKIYEIVYVHGRVLNFVLQ